MQVTATQMRVLHAIDDVIWRCGFSPSVRELAGELGLSSPSTVHAHLENLEALGLVSRRGPRKQGVRLTLTARSLLLQERVV